MALPAHALTADHYELALRPGCAAQVLEGHARIRLKPVGELNLQNTRAMVDGQPVALEKTSTGWRIALGVAPTSLELDHRAPAADGLVFGEQYVCTSFRPGRWLPCVGPDLTRATVAISLDLPVGQRSVVSGGARPYPLCTLGLAAGRFTEAVDPNDPRLRYLGVTDDAASPTRKTAGPSSPRWRTGGGATTSPARAGTSFGSTKGSLSS